MPTITTIGQDAVTTLHQMKARATAQPEAEFTAAVGEEVATVVRIALEMYGADAGRLA